MSVQTIEAVCGITAGDRFSSQEPTRLVQLPTIHYLSSALNIPDNPEGQAVRTAVLGKAVLLGVVSREFALIGSSEQVLDALGGRSALVVYVNQVLNFGDKIENGDRVQADIKITGVEIGRNRLKAKTTCILDSGKEVASGHGTVQLFTEEVNPGEDKGSNGQVIQFSEENGDAGDLITMMRIVHYAMALAEAGLIHLDPGAAAKSIFRGVIAQGMLSVGLAQREFARLFPSDWHRNYASVSLEFCKPVRVGDRLSVSKLLPEDTNVLWVSEIPFKVYNQKGQAVVTGEFEGIY